MDSNKQYELDADPKAIQQINFIENLDWTEGVAMFTIIEETKKYFRFFTWNSYSFVNLFCINMVYNDSI